MKEQIDKAVGLIALGFILIVTSVVGLIWNVIPSIILTALISAAISGIFWMLLQKYVSFQAIWLFITVIMYIGLMINQRKVEGQAKVTMKEMLKDDDEV